MSNFSFCEILAASVHARFPSSTVTVFLKRPNAATSCHCISACWTVSTERVLAKVKRGPHFLNFIGSERLQRGLFEAMQGAGWGRRGHSFKVILHNVNAFSFLLCKDSHKGLNPGFLPPNSDQLTCNSDKRLLIKSISVYWLGQNIKNSQFRGGEISLGSLIQRFWS